MMKKLISLSIICCSTIINTFSQIWIDKNENTNYVQRHECSFVQSGNTFIMFGGREQSKRLDIYDYSNNLWSQGTQAPIEFNHFQAIEYEGIVWVIGAFKDNNFPNETPVENIYLYNPALNIWMQGPEIPSARRRGGAGVVLYQNKFYLIAGNTLGHNGGYVPWVDTYDPINNTWQSLSDAPRSRDHFAAAIIGNKIYAVSGRLSGGTGGVFAPLVPEVDIYDINNNSWTSLINSKNLPTPRAGASVAVFQNEIFVIGGEGESPGPAFNKVEAYDPSSETWSTKSDMNYNRHGTQAIVSGNGIFIAGGSPVRGGGRQHNMEVYNVDAPVGTAITASVLNASSIVTFIGTETKNISLSASGGNAGCFIVNTEITGPDAMDFNIVSDLKLHLIKSNGSQDIHVQSNTTISNKTANLVVTYDNGKTATIELMTSSILSVDNFQENEKEIIVHPNPTNEILYLTSQQKVKSIQILDITGKNKLIKSIQNEVKKVEINVGFLSSGMYLLKVITDKGTSFKNIIIN